MFDLTNDASFMLLSGMSPKVDKSKKKQTKKKAPSRLAVRSALRRSSIYDNLPLTVTNKNIQIVDGSTDTSSDTGSSEKSSPIPSSYIDNLKTKNLLSETKICNIQRWIEEAKPETDEIDQNVSIFSTISSIHGESRIDRKIGGAVNSTFAVGAKQKRFDDYFGHFKAELEASRKMKNAASDKMEEKKLPGVERVGKRKIEENPFKALLEPLHSNERSRQVDKNKKLDLVTSLMSKYLDPAVNSDINDDSFQNLQNKYKSKDLFGNKVIDDSLIKKSVNSDDSSDDSFIGLKDDIEKRSEFNGALKKKGNLPGRDAELKNNYLNCNTAEKINKKGVTGGCFEDNKNDVIIIDDSFEENKENVDENRGGFISPTSDKDCLNLLDMLYGDKWRKNQDQVLPKSEPRPKKTKAKKVIAPKTEIKPKLLNPYLDSEKKRSRNLIGILDSARRKAALESPWVSKLKTLCDSGSESESNSLQRVQLNFEETSPINNRKNTGKTNLPHTRLQFDDDDFNDKSNKVGKKTKGDGKVKRINKESVSDKVKKITFNNKERVNLKSEYRNRKMSSSTGETCDSSSDFENIGISSADKIKARSTTKSATNLPKSKEKGRRDDKERKSSTSSSDSIDDFIKLISKNSTKDSKQIKHVDRVETKQRISSSSSSDSIEDKVSKFDDIFKRFNLNDKDTYKTSAASKPLSFLASLSKNVPPAQCDASAKVFKSCYKKNRQQLLEKLFKMYENIFENAIPSDTEIEWSERLVGTAGYCACKKITRRTGKIERVVRLVLSSKVLDSADRLRDTLVHELCHAATYLVNEVSDGHGPYWKAWATKAMKTYPELPAIKRCHDYAINTKYTYRCSNCGYSFGRHTKSIDLTRKRCGYCSGILEVFLNKVMKSGETKSVATPKKEPTGFALFVKENYAIHKAPNLKHGDVMKILSKKFQETKINNN